VTCTSHCGDLIWKTSRTRHSPTAAIGNQLAFRFERLVIVDNQARSKYQPSSALSGWGQRPIWRIPEIFFFSPSFSTSLGHVPFYITFHLLSARHMWTVILCEWKKCFEKTARLPAACIARQSQRFREDLMAKSVKKKRPPSYSNPSTEIALLTMALWLQGSVWMAQTSL
jgi:hypothetical protein